MRIFPETNRFYQRLRVNLILILSVTLILPFRVWAECSTQDPCVPKKDKDAWYNSLALGFNLTSGNSDTTLLTILENTTRETDSDLIDLGVNYNFGEDDKAKDENGDKTTRNDFRAQAGYNYKLSERWFTGFGTKFLNDEIAEVDYRVNLNPTVGYFLVKDADISFSLETGPGYTFEKVDDVKDEYFSPRIADTFNWVISCTSKLFQKAEVLFDVNDSDNYIFNGELGIEAAISSSLSLVVSLRETYDNQPAVDREKDDLALISALKVNL